MPALFIPANCRTGHNDKADDNTLKDVVTTTCGVGGSSGNNLAPDDLHDSSGGVGCSTVSNSGGRAGDGGGGVASAGVVDVERSMSRNSHHHHHHHNDHRRRQRHNHNHCLSNDCSHRRHRNTTTTTTTTTGSNSGSSRYSYRRHRHRNSVHAVSAWLWLVVLAGIQLNGPWGALASLPSAACSSACSHGTCGYPVSARGGLEAAVTCRCHPGWGGERCSVPCARSCGHGRCVFVGDRQVCLCRLGHVGRDCTRQGYDVVTLLSLARLIQAGPPALLQSAAVISASARVTHREVGGKRQQQQQQEVEIISIPSALGLLAATAHRLAFAAGPSRASASLPSADVEPKGGSGPLVVVGRGEGGDLAARAVPVSPSSSSSGGSDLGSAKAGAAESPVDPPRPQTPPPPLRSTDLQPRPPATKGAARRSSAPASGLGADSAGTGSGAGTTSGATMVVPLVENPREHVERNVELGAGQCMRNFVCRNGGRCVTGTFGGFRCLCTRPFFGTFCENSCPTPCHNGGRCMKLRHRAEETGPGAGDVSAAGSLALSVSGYRYVYRCVCPPLYTGQHCQRKVNSNG